MLHPASQVNEKGSEGRKGKGFKQEELSELYGSKRTRSVLCVCVFNQKLKKAEVTCESVFYKRENLILNTSGIAKLMITTPAHLSQLFC